MDKYADYYIVDARGLPDIMLKVVEVKRMLKSGEVSTVNEAVKQVGISRSAFYKYKDYIYPFYEFSRKKILTLSFVLEDVPGLLSTVLKQISESGANILTINQNLPVNGVADVIIQLDIENMVYSAKELLTRFEIDGVKSVDIIARG